MEAEMNAAIADGRITAEEGAARLEADLK